MGLIKIFLLYLQLIKLIIDKERFSESDPDICDNDTKTVTNQKNDANESVDGSTHGLVLDR